MLGTYTNFVNLLDLSAVTLPVAVPAAPGHPPHSLSLIGPAWSDATAGQPGGVDRRYARQPPDEVMSAQPRVASSSHRKPSTAVPSSSSTVPRHNGAGTPRQERAERGVVELPHLDLDRTGAGVVVGVVAVRTRPGLGGSVGSA